jgi:gliding motility-associated-like protein
MEDYVIVYPKPVADFITMPSSATEFDPYFEFYNYSLLGVTYLWNFDDSLSNANTATTTNSSHYYLSTGYYNPQLIAVTDRGCRDTISKSVYIEPQFTVFVPNAFTPNRDKKNDVFIPVGIGMDAERYLFQIFDRWGNLVFQTTDPTEGWTGLTTNGVEYFAEDVYIWKLETYDLNGNKIDRKGRLTLVR